MSGSTEGLARLPRHFYLSGPRPCPYLYGRVERSIFTELGGGEAGRLYEMLLRSGFRRSHQVAFRPACPECRACLPVRVVAGAFVERSWMRRIRKINAALSAAERPARATREQYALFRRYIATRHADGEMALMDYDDYRNMVEDSPIDSMIVEFRDDSGTLVAACLADRLTDGFSAVYSFFEPDAAWPSLGTQMILWLIETAQARSLPYVYLGYFVDGSRKMAYKARFRPLEVLGTDGWHPLESPAPQ
jgi:arginyl-tRNA--protein-N-Asp/Glu arginylyltransferase